MKYFINKFAAFSLVFLAAGLACKNDPDAEARKMKSCPALGCTSPNICLNPLNICVKPCLDNNDCAADFKCSGYFKSVFNFTGKGDKFCKQINASLGDDCSDYNTACPRDMSCVDGICKKICTSDDDCINQNYRCVMQVLPAKSFNADETYRVCARADADFQNKCEAGS
ncbi:MAG: hypothetical protein PF689_08955, partial [Deltaproteobacteria bacterium]|nr:hypothetical protein [Deltaproteobacteria bacterium]